MAANRLTPIAQKLRREATREEKTLWYEFLSKYPIRFRRQKVIGPYIVDFYCSKANLAIELDGSQHFEAAGLIKDEARTRWLEAYGVLVIRFSNHDVRYNLSGVCAAVDAVVKERLAK